MHCTVQSVVLLPSSYIDKEERLMGNRRWDADQALQSDRVGQVVGGKGLFMKIPRET